MLVSLGCLTACGAPEGESSRAELGQSARALTAALDGDLPAPPPSSAAPAADYTLFEADPVRPVAVLAASGLVLVTNTVDDSLELFQPDDAGVSRCGAVRVGMRPVAVAAVEESNGRAEVWVVNHLSDSVSVVSLDTSSCQGAVIDTLYTGDEPRDIVVTQDRAQNPRVFVAAAHRGQHHPVAGARLGTDLVTPPAAKSAPGLADVFVFDPRDRRAPPAVVNLFMDVPRALAVGDGVVYAAGFKTGNRTTAVHAERVAQRGVDSLSSLLATDESGGFIERDGELRLRAGARGHARIEGGMPAVSGNGRCMPDPRQPLRDRFLQQVCVATDAQQRAQRVVLQREGSVDASCQCTNVDGTLQPTTALIVRFFDSRRDCGRAYQTFPDGSRGCWLDAQPGGVENPARRAGEQATPMAWNEQVKLSLPDDDVFAIDTTELRPTRAFAGVGTVLFGMAAQPGSGRVFVTNTDAHNLTRFEGDGTSSSTTVRGHLYESDITVIEPERGRVRPVHLNDHIDYGRCCERSAAENDASLAFPMGGAFSPSGETFYFAALGSDSIASIDAAALEPGFDNVRARACGELRSLRLGLGEDAATGPVGLAVDGARQRVYVKTHISNELVVVDAALDGVLARASLHDPEPPSIKDGRTVLYDARATSAHGDSACASCHVFGDFDGLSWDLGNPAAASVNSPGPFGVPPELVSLESLARDPFSSTDPLRPQEVDFRSNKGPMSTQTLRGMANHGALHWRGDRTRRHAAEAGAQPDVGGFDEHASFGEFDVAIAGLNGNDGPLPPEVFGAFTDFALQLTLPPNPVRALDDSLSERQARARALFFGCDSLSDEQLATRQCVASGELVDIDRETQACRCAHNPLLPLLAQVPNAAAFGQLLAGLLSNPELSAALDATAADTSGLPADTAAEAEAALAAFQSQRAALLSADLSIGPLGLLSVDAAAALSGTIGALLQLLGLSAAPETPAGPALLALLAGAVPPEVAAAQPGLDTPDGFSVALGSSFGLSNLALRTALDESRRGSGEFRDMLLGCDPSDEPPACRLRVTDGFDTCNGCHTLDRAGNAELGVDRPGFFGTSGQYTFENVSQLMKVPHLRNQYQKAGMFGMPLVEFCLPESVLGPNAGGFFATENAFMGPQVRGFGFMHDGALDTLHRFHGTQLFAARAFGALGEGDLGNPEGFDSVFPRQSERAACVAQLRQAPAQAVAVVEDPELASALELCLASSPVPDVCFFTPDAEPCQQALAALGEALGDPALPSTFATSILPACFQLGSMLEQGAPDGHCAPSGLAERAAMEDFMLAFDSNLKPMVGQQLTLRDAPEPLLEPMLSAAQRGDCDIALRQDNRGYLLTSPDPDAPEQSRLERPEGDVCTLGDLLAAASPVTLTCYPPRPGRLEARRAAADAAP